MTSFDQKLLTKQFLEDAILKTKEETNANEPEKIEDYHHPLQVDVNLKKKVETEAVTSASDQNQEKEAENGRVVLETSPDVKTSASSEQEAKKQENIHEFEPEGNLQNVRNDKENASDQQEKENSHGLLDKSRDVETSVICEQKAKKEDSHDLLDLEGNLQKEKNDKVNASDQQEKSNFLLGKSQDVEACANSEQKLKKDLLHLEENLQVNKVNASNQQQEKKEEEEEWQDVLGSGVIFKKLLKQGLPDSKPSRSDLCHIRYTLSLPNGPTIETNDNCQMSLGEADVIQGLDVSVGLMNKFERCLLKIKSRLAYGAKGLPPHIPEDATVLYDVELLDYEQERDCETISMQERREIGMKKRERGNWWYQRDENTLAVQCYRRALDYLDEVDSKETTVNDFDLQQLLEDRLKVLNNMASAQIKMELYEQALTSLDTVLKCQPDNVKALFRKAKVHLAKNNLKLAKQLLEKARSLEPDDKLISKELAGVANLIEKQKNSEREYARRMFGGVKPAENKRQKTAKNKIQVWATLGATIMVGLAGMIAYKYSKYA